MKKIYLSVVVIVLFLVAGYFAYTNYATSLRQVACTMEAKICPDGSSVGRTGPNCEFTACPDETAGWETYNNAQRGFGIKYPAGCNFISTDENEGFFDYGRTKVASMGCEAAKWTEIRLAIYIDDSSKNIQGCLSGQGMMNAVGARNINGTNFNYWRGTDVAMGGQRALDNSYAAIYANKCVQITSAILYHDLDFIEGVSDQRFSAEEKSQHDLEIQAQGDLMNKIISTFKFTN